MENKNRANRSVAIELPKELQSCVDEKDRDPCSLDFSLIRSSLNVLGGKWKMLILTYLFEGEKRFGELKKLIPEVSEKMLIQSLKELEESKVINKKVYPQSPPKVEYSLSSLGKETIPILKSLYIWGEKLQKYL